MAEYKVSVRAARDLDVIGSAAYEFIALLQDNPTLRAKYNPMFLNETLEAIRRMFPEADTSRMF
jgi:hypothetical protein